MLAASDQDPLQSRLTSQIEGFAENLCCVAFPAMLWQYAEADVPALLEEPIVLIATEK